MREHRRVTAESLESDIATLSVGFARHVHSRAAVGGEVVGRSAGQPRSPFGANPRPIIPNAGRTAAEDEAPRQSLRQLPPLFNRGE